VHIIVKKNQWHLFYADTMYISTKKLCKKDLEILILIFFGDLFLNFNFDLLSGTG